MSSGKRYNSQKPKLNIKKVIAAVIVLAVIIMAITGIVKVFTGGSKSEEKTIPNRYFAVYTNNKWGVINSKGETVIKPQYDEAIIIPDNSKAIFICTYDVDYSKNTYKTKVVNAKNEEIIKGYDSITALENYDNENNIWYENDVLLASKDGKFGLVDFKGKELLKCEYDEITTLKGVKSSLITKKDGKFGLVDNIGATIIENTYTKIAPVSDKYEDGYIVTDSDKKMGVINHNKSTDVEVKYQDIKALGGNGKYVVKESGKWQVIDTEGNTYLKGKFDDVVSINGENVVIKNNGKYGVVTLSGDTKIATKYQEVKYLFDDKYIFKSENKYGVVNLEGEELTEEEIKKGLRTGTIANKIVPVTCGSSYKNKGVQELLDAIVEYMPSPLDIPHIKGETLDGEETEAKTSDTEPFAALAFKIATDPFVGKLCFFRVYSGTCTTGTTILNATKDKKDRIGRILLMHANHRQDIEKVYAGDIAAGEGNGCAVRYDRRCGRFRRNACRPCTGEQALWAE